jgi:hypothetical protein
MIMVLTLLIIYNEINKNIAALIVNIVLIFLFFSYLNFTFLKVIFKMTE